MNSANPSRPGPLVFSELKVLKVLSQKDLEKVFLSQSHYSSVMSAEAHT